MFISVIQYFNMDFHVVVSYSTNGCDGVVVGVSALHLVDLGFIS